jgi:hypothetical protein
MEKKNNFNERGKKSITSNKLKKIIHYKFGLKDEIKN